MLKIKIALVILLAIAAGLFVRQHNQPNLASEAGAAVNAASSSVAQQALKPNACKDNTLDKEVIISISSQHLWACAGTTTDYDNAVITGMQMYAADLTPVGTYKIYGRQVNQTLAGHDSTGSWNDFVYYWMPFLQNQYGTYGFHDLTQAANGAEGRSDSDFGSIDINAPFTATKHGSHGCIEMPLAAMKWLYDWAPVGTTVVINS